MLILRNASTNVFHETSSCIVREKSVRHHPKNNP